MIRAARLTATFVSGNRVSDPSWHVGGERAALPPTMAVCVSVGFTGSLGPGRGVPAAGLRPASGSISGGRNNL